MANKTNLFLVGDTIQQKKQTPTNNQKLIIDFIDYTRNVYIFNTPWIYGLTKYDSCDFLKVESLFHKI